MSVRIDISEEATIAGYWAIRVAGPDNDELEVWIDLKRVVAAALIDDDMASLAAKAGGMCADLDKAEIKLWHKITDRVGTRDPQTGRGSWPSDYAEGALELRAALQTALNPPAKLDAGEAA